MILVIKTDVDLVSPISTNGNIFEVTVFAADFIQVTLMHFFIYLCCSYEY